MSIHPRSERMLFEARHKFDLLVIYDMSSISMPSQRPPDPSSSPSYHGREEAANLAQAGRLWTLLNAIYLSEAEKGESGTKIKRSPVLLAGGWMAWKKIIGEKGIDSGRATSGLSGPSTSGGDVEVRNGLPRPLQPLDVNGQDKEGAPASGSGTGYYDQPRRQQETSGRFTNSDPKSAYNSVEGYEGGRVAKDELYGQGRISLDQATAG